MFLGDLISIIKWWLVFLVIGSFFIPLTITIFKNFFDKGYIFSKIIGMVFISYIVFVLGILHIAPFTIFTILAVSLIFLIINLILFKKDLQKTIKENWVIFLLEETLFLIGISAWTYVRGHNPDIHGLEKFMDFGFINSILRSDYFPPKDMWFTPFPINYYYFGHLITAVLTKISLIPSYITYNLMLATLFSFTFTCSFSIGANLIHFLLLRLRGGRSGRAPDSAQELSAEGGYFERTLTGGKLLTGPRIFSIAGGLLTAFLVSLSGNLHTIYAFFQKYPNENPVPFWKLAFSPFNFPNDYWYPNATRFIYNTIHEFPAYSFVVSDLHGHVLDIPIVLLIIAILLSLLTNGRWKMINGKLLLLGFFLAIAYMTNVWDGIIYFLLSMLVIFSVLLSSEKFYLSTFIKYLLILIVGFVLFTMPFNLNFKPFASGIGVLCAPEFLIEKAKLGSFLFEADHCQKSPWWQMLTLHGFFYFWAISFMVFLYRSVILRTKPEGSRFFPFAALKGQNDILKSDLFVLFLIFLSTVLIIIPEFIYLKDIYPAHYRANTMFKLTYQEFIMLSIASGYIIVRLLNNLRLKNWKFIVLVFIGSIGLFLVMLYPFFAVGSYYGNLRTYRGIDGLKYLESLYPDDYKAILWINKNIKRQPVMLEAQGDSYTDFARISSNTGLPTILGWTVHEWLWRGSYDVPSPRINEVDLLYNSKDINQTMYLISKYKVGYAYFGSLELQKYPNLSEDKFRKIGDLVYQNQSVRIYKINSGPPE